MLTIIGSLLSFKAAHRGTPKLVEKRKEVEISSVSVVNALSLAKKKAAIPGSRPLAELA
jgi:hypothetical protein